MRLYSYPKSTTSYRVRAALNLKGIDYDIAQVDLIEGAQQSADFQAMNPAKAVPVLMLDDGTTLTQSMAILDYLDTTYPSAPSRMYYSAAEQLCHHAIGGCGMNTGDLLGSGTISGPTHDEFRSLFEKSWAGRKPFTLKTGETRSFIEDGDTLTLKAEAQGDGYVIGFGECSGKIRPAIKYPA